MILSDNAVHLVYHYEDESWWADSLDLPSLFAGGETLAEAKKLARQVVAEELGADTPITEWVPMPESMELTRTITRSDDERPAVFEGWESAERVADWEPNWSLPQRQHA